MAAPNNATYKISLQRAMQAASRAHLEKAYQYEREISSRRRSASSRRRASSTRATGRPRPRSPSWIGRFASASMPLRPKPPIQGMRERARAASAEPILNPASREPINFHFNNVSLRDIMNAIGAAHGISVSFDREFADRPATVNIEGATLEQALNQIMTMNQLSYKVMGEKSIFIFQDTPPKHAQYDDQVIRTFLSVARRLDRGAADPQHDHQAAGHRGAAGDRGQQDANTITVRGTTSVVGILEKIIEQNDKPRAEVVVDVEILEVDATDQELRMNLSEYAAGAIFSPETSPSSTTTASNGHDGFNRYTSTNTGSSTPPSGVRSPRRST
jgi:type II secretory pathway component HofQ